jgi:hypothetical protein
MLFFTRIILTIRQLLEFHETDMLFMNPPWQRDRVWSKKETEVFIKSVVEDDSPIPELCFWERPDEVNVPVDGKQRSTALIGFVTDDVCYYNDNGDDVWFSLMSQEDKDAILDTEMAVLLIGPESDQADVIAYYLTRNTTGKSLVAGEKLKALNTTAINVTTATLFAERATVITNAFGKKKEAKRSGDLANRVPYLASFASSLDHLTTAIKGITQVLADTTQAQVDAILPRFTVCLDTHIAVCARIVRENPEQKSKWQGFPPLGKVSSIWVSIVEPALIADRDPSEFWSAFYERLRGSPALASAWDEKTRKNATAVTLRAQVDWAVLTVGPQ